MKGEYIFKNATTQCNGLKDIKDKESYGYGL